MPTGELILTPPAPLLPGRQRAVTPDRSPKLPGVIAGHLWTVIPSLISSTQPLAGPPARTFHATVEDPIMGEVRLTDLFTDLEESDTLVLIVHGLAGNAHSPYCAVASCSANQKRIESPIERPQV